MFRVRLARDRDIVLRYTQENLGVYSHTSIATDSIVKLDSGVRSACVVPAYGGLSTCEEL